MSSANDRIKELEQRLTEAEKIAKRYHDMYVKEKEQQSQRNKSSQSQSKPAATDESEPTDQANDQLNNNDDRKWLTDADLDDDEAVYKRHVLRMVDTKSMKDTAPIRVQDIIRKNEVTTCRC